MSPIVVLDRYGNRLGAYRTEIDAVRDVARRGLAGFEIRNLRPDNRTFEPWIPKFPDGSRERRLRDLYMARMGRICGQIGTLRNY